MSYPSMGCLPNAPLAYVLAQAVFQPILSVEKRMPEIQEALKAKYPRMKTTTPTISIKVNDGSEIPVKSPNIWEFTNKDKTEGVRIAQNMIVFHATEYKDYSDFSAKVNDAASTITSIIGNLVVTRLGMRYIDYILPKDSMTLEQMLISGVKRAPSIGLGEKNSVGLSILQYNMENGALNVKYSYGSGTPPFPQELTPLTLNESKRMTYAQDISGDTAILDFDRYMTFDEEMDLTNIMENYKKMHADLAQAFKGITTDVAKTYWAESA